MFRRVEGFHGRRGRGGEGKVRGRGCACWTGVGGGVPRVFAAFLAANIQASSLIPESSQLNKLCSCFLKSKSSAVPGKEWGVEEYRPQVGLRRPYWDLLLQMFADRGWSVQGMRSPLGFG